MGSIRKRGDYQFQAQVRRVGYPPLSKTFDTRKDAEKWVRAVEREMDTGSFISRGEAERTTIANLADRYLRERVALMRSPRQEEQRVNAVIQKFGNYNLSAVTPAMVADWRDELAKTLRPQTIQHYVAVLGRLYKAATKDFGIPLPLGNPAANVRLPSINNERSRIIDAHEEQKLFESLDKSRGKHLKSIVILALETAMRRGELLALRWQNIDLVKRTALLPITKNGEARLVPLSTKAKEVLQGLPRNISGRVFSTSETAITEGFQRAVLRAKLSDLHFHDLRHIATTRLAEKLAMHELAKVTGHKSPRMLMRYYHPKAEDLAKKLG